MVVVHVNGVLSEYIFDIECLYNTCHLSCPWTPLLCLILLPFSLDSCIEHSQHNTSHLTLDQGVFTSQTEMQYWVIPCQAVQFGRSLCMDRHLCANWRRCHPFQMEWFYCIYTDLREDQNLRNSANPRINFTACHRSTLSDHLGSGRQMTFHFHQHGVLQFCIWAGKRHFSCRQM